MTVPQMTLGFRWIVTPDSSRSFDPVPWDAQPDQSCLHRMHHSMFIFQKNSNAWKKLTRIRISFIRIIHDKIVPISCTSCISCTSLHYRRVWKDSSLWFLTERIADHRPHRYSTRLNQQRSMDQVQAELAEMRANMVRFMTLMQEILTVVIPGGIYHNWVTVGVTTVVHKSL
jgi:hypothetical protein